MPVLRRLDPTSGAAAALLICCGVLCGDASLAHAASEESGIATGDYAAAKKSADICADAAQPPAARVASCTLVRKQAVLTDAGRAIVLHDRANALMALGKREEALADLSDALKLNPNDDIRTAVRLLPSFAPAHAALGVVLKAKDPNAALAEFNRALELDAQSTALNSRAGLYLSLGQFEAASLAIDPKYIKALIGRADENYGARRFADSLADYTLVIEAQPKNAEVFFKRGSVYFDLGDFAAAYRDYSVSLTLDPKQPDVLRNRALAAERMGTIK